MSKNLSSALKDEITRVSRKEIKEEVTPLKKSSATYRHEIATLKKRVKDLESLAAKLLKQLPAQPKGLAPVTLEKAARWSAKRFAALRAKLKLSAKDMGLIIGVSAATIYNWEDEASTNRPKAAQMPKIVAARKLTAVKAKALLKELAK